MTKLTLLPDRKPNLKLDVSLAIINIVLLLILFFLTAGTLVEVASFEADPARTSSLGLETLPDPVMEIAADGAWILNGEPIAPADLALALGEETVLHVVLDRTSTAIDLVELMRREELQDLTLRLVTINSNGAP